MTDGPTDLLHGAMAALQQVLWLRQRAISASKCAGFPGSMLKAANKIAQAHCLRSLREAY